MLCSKYFIRPSSGDVRVYLGVLLSDRIDKTREQPWVQDPRYLDLGLILANITAPSAVLAYEMYRQRKLQGDFSYAKQVAKEKAEEDVSDECMKMSGAAVFENPIGTE